MWTLIIYHHLHIVKAVAVSNNDLVNKLYVDTVAPRVAYIVYLNYSETFITTTPNTYKKLSSTEIFANQTVPFTTTNGTPIKNGWTKNK